MSSRLNFNPYKWTLPDDVHLSYPSVTKGLPVLLQKGKGTLANLNNWGSINAKGIRIKKGYSWDGCSPKVRIFGKLFGTWDGPRAMVDLQKAYYPSLVHDILCQFEGKVPFTRKEIDEIFYVLLCKADFPFPRTYHFFVSTFRVAKQTYRAIKKRFK